MDHRLFAADEYNNRVLAYQLDSQNRLLERDARWVFGQKDVYSAESIRSARHLRIPLALAYDKVDKRLYVGDGWHDRFLIFDADPEHLEDGGGHEAIAVLGQPDFDTQDPRPTIKRFDFAVTRGRGIASSLIPLGVAIDEKRRRAFISDGGNNRVLVFDIHRDRLQNGADAIAVLGQPDFTSKGIRLTASGMNSPGHMTYDQDRDRLFVVDSLHHRVLVFDVAPEKLTNGMAPSFVIGQPDFVTTLSPQEVRRYLTIPTPQSITDPNGIVYDPAKDYLYVTDRGNDRIMAFDVAPEKMVNHPYAVAVLGQRSDESHSSQVEADHSGQDQLYDPRGMAIDSENQQLYAADSHFARIVVYNFPETKRPVNLPSRGVSTFSSLDPHVVLNPWERRSGFVTMESEAEAVSFYMFTRTRFELEHLSGRQSRILLSQFAASAPEPTRQALLFVEGRSGRTSSVFLANPGEEPASVQFTLRQGSSEAGNASRTLQPGTSLTASIADLMGATVETGTLQVRSSVPVAVTAWYEAENHQGEDTAAALPLVRDLDSMGDVLPNLMAGGGYETDVVLLNTGDTSLRGVLSVRDRSGEEVEEQTYAVGPGSSFVYSLSDSGTVPRRRYAVARPDSSAPPVMTALIRRLDEGLITATTVESLATHTLARIAVDTMPNLIHHGLEKDLHFIVANANEQSATVRFILRDLDGREVDRYEQIVLPGHQRPFSMSRFFGRTQFAGSVLFFSDLPVGLSARLTTVNLRGDEILTELPVVLGKDAAGPVVYPFVDGEGHSTQIVISAPEESAVQSELSFFTPDGEVMEVIIR